MAARRLLHGRYYRIPGTAERYYDTIAHRSISSHTYRTKVRGLEEGHKRRRRIVKEYERLHKAGLPPSGPETERESLRQEILLKLWVNLRFRGTVPGGYTAEDGPARPRALRSEYVLRQGELPNSQLFRRIWRVMSSKERRAFKGPNGQYAHALEEWGERPYNAWWNVGDTPKVMAGKSVGAPSASQARQRRKYLEFMARTPDERRAYIQESLDK